MTKCNKESPRDIDEGANNTNIDQADRDKVIMKIFTAIEQFTSQKEDIAMSRNAGFDRDDDKEPTIELLPINWKVIYLMLRLDGKGLIIIRLLVHPKRHHK